MRMLARSSKRPVFPADGPAARRRRRAGFAVLGLLGGASSACAHPHVWIVATSELVFDESRRLSAIRHSWTFDEAYSAFMTMNLDSKRDGVPDSDKLADLARTNLTSIAEFGFFTRVKVGGKPLAFAAADHPVQAFKGGRLTLSFSLPLASPIPAPKVLVMNVDDPTFFVAFRFAPGPEAVRLAGPPNGCIANITRAARTAEDGQQIVPDEEAASAAPRIGADYASRVIVACP